MQTMATRLREGLAAAIGALNDDNGRGGAAKLAAHLGVSQAAISQWDAIPVKRVAAIASLTGVSPDVLRPDHHAATPSRKKAA